MKVGFIDSVKGKVFDTVVIVSYEQRADFVEKKIAEYIGDIPNGIKDKLRDLKNKKIHCFDFVLSGKFVKFIVAGAGKKETLERVHIEKLGGFIYDAIKAENASVLLFNNLESIVEEASALLISGIYLKSWTFEKYKSEKGKTKIDSIEGVTAYMEKNRTLYQKLSIINENVFLVRDLVTEPANVVNPDMILEEAENLKKFGIKVNCLKKKDMEKLGMNAILGVGQGSAMPTYLITMEYQADRKKPVVALVGKGLTFDSGGISIKPSNKMGEMKCDMTGAAVVIGVLRSLAMRKLDINVVGTIGVTENMPSGTAQRPGDVLKSMSGKTIEVDNTDAEGRLVLADAIWYTEEKYAPEIVIDIATLTGAIQVALGHEFAGLFSNSETLSKKLLASSKNIGEKLWELPVHDDYDQDISSDIADMKNVGSGRGAGSITAAMFLKRFIKDGVKWAHLDIAAVETDSKSRALSQKGATGFGVRLLNDFIASYY
ncbi:MAG: leucyl aminopeptidase [Holosporales bacterium]|jgi:leucyl aminopeptidase|nr:leucyl aminopeptidase [Holosporales bacterium]